MSTIFMDKNQMPNDAELQKALGKSYDLWKTIRDYTLNAYPKALEEWNFPGIKYGWSFRIKDKKRAIIYLLPDDKHFRIALVYGEKATNQALNSSISKEIKGIIEAAPVYAEGRGFRLDVTGTEMIADIKQLIDIKIAN